MRTRTKAILACVVVSIVFLLFVPVLPVSHSVTAANFCPHGDLCLSGLTTTRVLTYHGYESVFYGMFGVGAILNGTNVTRAWVGNMIPLGAPPPKVTANYSITGL